MSVYLLPRDGLFFIPRQFLKKRLKNSKQDAFLIKEVKYIHFHPPPIVYFKKVRNFASCFS